MTWTPTDRVVSSVKVDAETGVEVRIQVTYSPTGESEAIGHYLTNQAAREVVAELDRASLDRSRSEDDRTLAETLWRRELDRL